MVFLLLFFTDIFSFPAKKLMSVTLVSMDVTSTLNAPIRRVVTSARARLVTMEMDFHVIVSLCFKYQNCHVVSGFVLPICIINQCNEHESFFPPTNEAQRSVLFYNMPLNHRRPPPILLQPGPLGQSDAPSDWYSGGRGFVS